MILRPGDLRGSQEEPTRRVRVVEDKTPMLTPEWISAYDHMSASQAKSLCETDSNFNALADELYQKRNPKGEGRP
jgi:hypothetical protein